MIKINKALKQTMQDCGVRAVWLSQKTGIAEATISKFLQGKTDMLGANIERIIEALPSNAQGYFFNLLYPRTNTMKALLEDATQEEKIEALRIVAASLENINNSSRKDDKKPLTVTCEAVPV